MALRTFYCQSCSFSIARDELSGETCVKCGSTHFGTQPKPHSATANVVSPFDRDFLKELRIAADEA